MRITKAIIVIIILAFVLRPMQGYSQHHAPSWNELRSGLNDGDEYSLNYLFRLKSNLDMALWKVPDSTTALFMEHFYKNLINGVPIHEALKAAQNYLINNGAEDPFYWAPFVLID